MDVYNCMQSYKGSSYSLDEKGEIHTLDGFDGREIT
jgi:hypothetical protein